MKFAIITPTYNRFDLLVRNIESVQKQDYPQYEHIIIDDSTQDKTQKNIKRLLSDKKIRYYKNDSNKWVNYSRNFWIKMLSPDVDYVIFLDDDDYFNTWALTKAYEIIKKHNHSWYVSNKKWISKIQKYDTTYNYFDDYFLWTKIQWDTSHIIKKDILKSIRFSPYIKQAEEWLFFIELWYNHTFYAYDFDTIISDYLSWWLSDNDKQSRYKIIFRHIIAVLEFLCMRKLSIKFKVYFLKNILIK